MVVVLAGLATFGLRLFAQDAPAANQRPMQGHMQERMGAGMMQGHQEIADAVKTARTIKQMRSHRTSPTAQRI